VTDVASLTRILCVDDEPRVLEGIALNLRKRYAVLATSSGAAALEMLALHGPIAVVLCDLRMPGMDGTQFLQRARQIAPDTVRVLLTGHADVKTAMAAVNEGQVFRFLTKPCPPTVLLPTLEAAVEQHRQQASERAILEGSLKGAVKALTDVLALASPPAFERATRLTGHVASMGKTVELADTWSLEVAATLSQLGFLGLPAELVDRVLHGRPVSDEEAERVKQVPVAAERLLASIPRLEPVRELLAAAVQPVRTLPEGADAAAVQQLRAEQVLRAAMDYEDLIARGQAIEAALAALRGRDAFVPEVLDALTTHVMPAPVPDPAEGLSLSELRVGMIVAENVYMTSGTMLVAQGFEITQGFLGRARNLRPGAVREPIRVLKETEPKPARPVPPEVPL
jgi:CheY-like chemotaxis protein